MKIYTFVSVASEHTNFHLGLWNFRMLYCFGCESVIEKKDVDLEAIIVSICLDSTMLWPLNFWLDTRSFLLLVVS